MVDLLLMIGGVALFPWFGLAFLLWMAWLEDSLPAAVRRTGQTPDPAPILAIEVGPRVDDGPGVGIDPVATAPMPGQRQASEVALSAEASLGGSTNR